MSEKQWRIQDEETFIDRSLEYLAPIVSKFMTGKIKITDYEKRKRINSLLSNITFDRIKHSVTNEDKMALIYDMLKIAVEDVQDWTNFSLDPNSPLDDIMLRAILTEKFSISFVCFAYLSKNPNLTEDFVRDMNYVNSGVFKFEDFDDDHVNAINAILENDGANPYDIPELRKLYKLKNKNDKLAKVSMTKIGSYIGICPPKLDYKELNKSDNMKNCLNKYKNIHVGYLYNKSDEEEQ